MVGRVGIGVRWGGAWGLGEVERRGQGTNGSEVERKLG